MGEVLGLVVVLGIIGLLIYELIRQIMDLKFAPISFQTKQVIVHQLQSFGLYVIVKHRINRNLLIWVLF